MHNNLQYADFKVKQTFPDLQSHNLHNADMEKHDRLKLARKLRFRTARAASEALGVPYGTYSGHEAGSRGFSDEDAERYAKAFRVSLAWLALGEGAMANGKTLATPIAATSESATVSLDAISVSKLYVRMVAEAGNWREQSEYTDIEEPEWYLVPQRPGDPLRRFLTKIAGDSMDKARLFDGDFVVTIDWNDLDRPANDGEIVVVQQTRDGGHTIETTVKQIRVHKDRYELHPRSSNPKHKAITVKHGDGEADGRVVTIIGLVESVFRPILGTPIR